MSLRLKLTAAGLAVGALSAVIGGTAGTASASAQSRASSGSNCTIAAPGQPGKTIVTSCPVAGAGAGTATTPAGLTSAAATPAVTPPDPECRGRSTSTNPYYGWFGVAPGSSADGGVANDLWWDAKQNATPAQMQIYTGNGGANQQWCEQYLGQGAYAFYSLYTSYNAPQCLTVYHGYVSDYAPGQRVYADTCDNPSVGSDIDQDWYVCPRSGNSVSLQPIAALTRSVWLDVWGGGSNNGKSAFVPMNPLQIWTGNGQDNQRFTFYPSPGEPGLSYGYTTGVEGC
jgi:hypothetical protein